ncbi:Hypp8946 [Branchiostoma lanceolatum]|uniref:Galactose mutarotase n=1 Tax=Branchiostoma lanceolatum TaxID=7740 RepID=A0A8J9ZAI6_BRALA|nr:Hypp8946 [Branchiostoma lanceolatum]
MCVRGKGGRSKRLGKSTWPRRAVLLDNVNTQRIAEPTIHRFAHRGGLKRIPLCSLVIEPKKALLQPQTLPKPPVLLPSYVPFSSTGSFMRVFGLIYEENRGVLKVRPSSKTRRHVHVKTFQVWRNSTGFSSYVNHLYNDLVDGLSRQPTRTGNHVKRRHFKPSIQEAGTETAASIQDPEISTSRVALKHIAAIIKPGYINYISMTTKIGERVYALPEDLVENTGETTFNFTTLLHNYFRVDDIRSVTVSGMQGLEYIDKTRNFERFTERRELLTVGEFVDYVYINTPSSHVITGINGGRTMRMDKENFPDTVVWNPWETMSPNFPDLGNEEYLSFICVEAGHVVTPVTLTPGEEFTAVQTLTL